MTTKSIKQLVFLDTLENKKSGTFERFHAEGVTMHSDSSIRLSHVNGNVDNGIMVLDINGHVLADKVRSRSDERLKTNIQNIRSGLGIIRQLCGKTYQMKCGNPENTSYGLIAQDVRRVLPNLVTSDTDGFLNVSYIELIPFLIESIKELDTKIEMVINSLA
jgi:hypothetical protein